MTVMGNGDGPQRVLGGTDDHYRMLVDAVTDYAIYMLDRHGRVASWNPGAQRFKGYTAAEILGQHFSRFYTEEDLQIGLPARALATAAGEGRFENEGWRLRKDGTRFWAHVVIDSIRDEHGELIGFAKITRDISDKRAAEQELQATREALFQAQKMEAIGQLSGGIAHDFNNLLMAILSSLELAQKRLPDDPKLKRFIDNAIQGANRGASLTQRMLAFARRQTLSKEAVSLTKVVGGLKDLLRRSLGPSIEVGFDFPAELSDVMVDVNQLESAILNVVVNARDAMPNGGALFLSARGAEITSDSDHGLAAGDYVCLAVSDTGTGMDEETLAKAGEPFFTTKGVGKGTGLGLSQVHGLLQQLGGRFILKSTLGVGTIAEFWLPATTTVTEASHRLVAAGEQAISPTRKLRVLAVDDDPLVLMNTAAMLEDMGHLVRDATSGREALDILRQEPAFDLIITDMAMPAMNGADFARLVRADWPNLPILLATGYAEPPDDTQLRLPLLGKPFGERELAKGIGLALGHPV
nr:PAS domain-containing sensor histidine kinase [uncultured Dongia sp.]